MIGADRMDRSLARLIAAPDNNVARPPGVALPRVAVIVTCFNYGRFAADALASVAAQTYSLFECVVIDDASTDDSAQIVEQWIADKKDARFRLIRSKVNEGQLAGVAKGLAVSEGEFVAMLDADDFWFPDFLQRHVEVHLNSAVLTSMSYSDQIQVDHAGTLLSGTCRWREWARTGGNKPWKRLRKAVVPRVSSSDGGWEPLRTGEVRYFPPGLTWRSAGMSAMVFRRAMLALAVPARHPGTISIGADVYLNMICHYFTGSFCLEDALGAYRRHGGNSFARMPVVGTMALFSPFGIGRWAFVHDNYRLVLGHLLDRFDDFANIFTPTRVRPLIRWLMREFLQTGEPFDDARVSAVLGRGRVRRDRMRARLRRLRRPFRRRH
jgi:glycosyltransferase involved in cell wall biosynthesis